VFIDGNKYLSAEKFLHINMLVTDSTTKLINFTKLNKGISYLLACKTIFP